MNLKAILFGALAAIVLVVTTHAQVVITPGRAITITVSGVPVDEKSRVDGTYPVSESGTINMPHIGEVKAAGLRSDELQRVLQTTYKAREIYTNPTFQVLSSSADTLVEQVVHIGGQVRKTGPTKFTQGLTIYQAVQAAGGATEFGSMKRVKLFRATKQRQYDLTKQENMSVVLEPNDTIEVPDKDIWGN